MDKKFRKLNQTELKNEILKVIKPEVNIDSLESLFSEMLSKDLPEAVVNSSDVRTTAATIIHPGLAGLWSGPLEEHKVGVVVPRGEDDVLQLYASGRHGYYAEGHAVDLEEWCLIMAFDNVSYVTKAKIVYLQF